jgi:23S rRNA pseudouridine1911/1915/1917 synthase
VHTPLTVLYEDNHLLAIDKPAGLPTMGAPAGKSTALVLAKRYIKQKYRKPGNVYLGVMSRLDAPVSGVLLLARTSKAAARLTEQFQRGTVEKVYWALVQGELDADSGNWSDWLSKDDAAQRVRVVPAAAGSGKEARLEFRRLATPSRGATLVEVRPRTGRKHQIRVQFASRGWPVLGDKKYGGSTSFPNAIALHARRLTVDHPTRGTRIELEAPLPKSWNRWLETKG